MTRDVHRPPGRFAFGLVRAWAGVQLIYGLIFIVLRFMDPYDFRKPFIIMGVPFLFIACGLWCRRRWGLWLGLIHSALRPATITAVGAIVYVITGPEESGLGSPSWGPGAGLGATLAMFIAVPLYFFNVSVFLMLLLIPRVRRLFNKTAS